MPCTAPRADEVRHYDVSPDGTRGIASHRATGIQGHYSRDLLDQRIILLGRGSLRNWYSAILWNCVKLKPVRKLFAIWVLLVTLATGGATAVATRSLHFQMDSSIVWLRDKRREAQADLHRRALPKPGRIRLQRHILVRLQVVETLLCFSLFERPPPVLSV